MKIQDMYNIYSGIERPTNYKRYDTINNISIDS